jgi:hypothetical protein
MIQTIYIINTMNSTYLSSKLDGDDESSDNDESEDEVFGEFDDDDDDDDKMFGVGGELLLLLKVFDLTMCVFFSSATFNRIVVTLSNRLILIETSFVSLYNCMYTSAVDDKASVSIVNDILLANKRTKTMTMTIFETNS